MGRALQGPTFVYPFPTTAPIGWIDPVYSEWTMHQNFDRHVNKIAHQIGNYLCGRKTSYMPSRTTRAQLQKHSARQHSCR